MSPDRIALSYDDGPSAWTPAILDLLASHGARATFFVIGFAAERDPDLVRRIHDEGHEVGNHTWSHPDLANGCSDAEVRTELVRTGDLLQELLGTRPSVFRAPRYACDERVLGVAADLGLRHARGDITPPDWLPGARGAVITTLILQRAVPGAIVGLHDGAPPAEQGPLTTREPTVQSTAQVLPRLAQRGLACVTVSEVLGL